MKCETRHLIPSHLLALEVVCENCDTVVLSAFVWKFTRQGRKVPYSIWAHKSPTGNKKKSLVLLPGILKHSTTYTFKVRAYYSNNASNKEVRDVFTTNVPPKGGRCSITPRSGKTLITVFTVTCSGYKDQDKPITYKIYQKKKDKSEVLLIYGQQQSTRLKLPAGPPESDSWLNLNVHIADSYGTSRIYPLSIQVHNPKEMDKDGLGWLNKATNELINKKLADFLPVALVIAETLKEIKSPSDEEKKLESKIRDTLMGRLTTYTVKTLDQLSQMSILVEDLILQEDNISPSMGKNALTMSKKLADDLGKALIKDTDLARTIVRKQCNAMVTLIGKQRQAIKDTDLNKIKTKIKPLVNVIRDISNHVLKSLRPVDEGPVKIKTDQISLTVHRTKPAADEFQIVAYLENSDSPGGFITFPNNMKAKQLDLQMMFIKENPFQWSETAKKVNLPVMDISVKRDGRSITPTNLQKPADIFISINPSNKLENDTIYNLEVLHDRVSHKVKNSSMLHLVTPVIKGTTQILKIYVIDSLLKLQLVVGASESDVSLKNLELKGFDWPFEDGALLTYKNLTQDPHLLFLPNDILGKGDTKFHIVLRVKLGQVIPGDPVKSRGIVVQVGIKTFTVQCSYWNQNNQDWLQDGCEVSPFTTQTTLHCWCNHLSVFSGGIFIAPNTVDPIGDLHLFLTFFDNPVVITLVVAVWIIFFQMLVWARVTDKKDLRKTGITVLMNTFPTDRYVYMLCVVTGWWAQAGTTSRVFIYLCGRNGRSSRHALFDSSKKLFISGAENWFMLRTTHSLGRIKSVVVWHDNGGERPSWYLKEIVVKDVQTDEVWHCLYDEWLSVDKGLGTIQADIPAIANATYAKKRFYQFMQTTSRHFRNGHIWISIFSKPLTSNFTRVQRLTCALCILLTVMLSNIMFHGIPRDDPEDQIDHGDFHLSLVDFVIGIESSLIVFPINLIIIYMFVFSKQRPDAVLNSDISDDDRMALLEKKKNLLSKFSLPWYFIHVAYFIAVTLNIISSFFVMLYGLKYGYHKSVSWLLSFFTSFFQSAFVTEPVKVLAVAFLLTLVFRQSVTYDTGVPMEIEHEVYTEDEYGKTSHYITPVSQRLLKKIRTRIIMDQRTWEIFVEIMLYFTYVAIVFLVVLGHSDVKESYIVTKSIEDIYVSTFDYNRTLYFYNVTDSHSMWEYLNKTFVENVIFGEYTPVSNTVAYLVGTARLRQIRVRRELCETEYNTNSSEVCFPPYSERVEENRTYTKNWENKISDEAITEWSYQSGEKLGTLPIMGRLTTYPGGGYIRQLPRNPIKARELIEKVKKTKWIDQQTRVVILEFTLFNANVQLFTVVELLFEYSNTGFVFPYHLIYTANFYHYQNEFETFVALVEILFVIYLFIFTYAEIKKCCRMNCLEYFSDSWTFVELIILLLAYTTIGLFINRLLVCNHVMDIFEDDDFDKFANFHTAAFYDALLRYVMATLILLVILKFFKLLRFNVRLSMLAQTLHSAKGKLLAYSFGLFGVAMAFAIFAVLVFGSVLEGYRNFPRTVITMFLFMLGQSDYYGLYETDAIFGPFFFFVFSLSFQFIFVQYFITLLMDAFHTTRVYIASVKTEVHMVRYILRKFRLVIMLDAQKRQTKRRITEGF